VVNDEKAIDAITRLFATQVPFTYIADGHHPRCFGRQSKKKALGSKASGRSRLFF